MGTVYRDFGAIDEQENTHYPDNHFETTYHGQVYEATHDGEGSSLPYMNRSFISFTFGGKKIESFDLIATFSSNRLNRNGSAEFEDRVSTYDILNGQQYWATHYRANELEFQLSTDGIDQKKLEDFLQWFRAGDTRELILAEHPNRGILARVAQAPQLNLLPFEHNITFKIAGNDYKTKTTLYKGDISIKFVMDEPHWYALDNILGIKKDGSNVYVDEWIDADGHPVNIFASQDALKILYEDGIPLGSIIQKDMLLGNGALATVEGHEYMRIWDIADDELHPIIWTDGVPSGSGARIAGEVTAEMKEADNDGKIKSAIGTYIGKIAGAIINGAGEGILALPTYDEDHALETCGHFYYSGTAPAPTIIRFTMTPTINEDGYIISPRNKHTRDNDENEVEYDTITIESENKQELQFTTPNIYTSFNKVIEIFDVDINGVNSWEKVRERIREEVRHAPTREWAMKVLDDAQSSSENDAVATATKSDLNTNMAYFLEDNSGVIQSVTFTFNSETGKATGTFNYRTVSDNSPQGNFASYEAASLTTEKEEDVGDMLRSNYIILRDRNMPTDQGYIKEWEVDHKLQSHRIYHNISNEISKVSIWYKNMYL